MDCWEWTLTIDGGAVHTLIFGRYHDGTGYFNHEHKVLVDAHQIPHQITHGGGLPLETSNLSSTLESNRKYSYVVTITNRGHGTIMYHLRVWVQIPP
jgi:hypothetical protein